MKLCRNGWKHYERPRPHFGFGLKDTTHIGTWGVRIGIDDSVANGRPRDGKFTVHHVNKDIGWTIKRASLPSMTRNRRACLLLDKLRIKDARWQKSAHLVLLPSAVAHVLIHESTYTWSGQYYSGLAVRFGRPGHLTAYIAVHDGIARWSFWKYLWQWDGVNVVRYRSAVHPLHHSRKRGELVPSIPLTDFQQQVAIEQEGK